MKLVQIETTAQVKPYQTDRLGYLYCGACLETETHCAIDRPPRHSGSDACDGCGAHPEEWPERTERRTATIELTPARIF